jgi:hypothetical protein
MADALDADMGGEAGSWRAVLTAFCAYFEAEVASASGASPHVALTSAAELRELEGELLAALKLVRLALSRRPASAIEACIVTTLEGAQHAAALQQQLRSLAAASTKVTHLAYHAPLAPATAALEPSDLAALNSVREIAFQYPVWQPGQLPALGAALAGHDVVLHMGTGSGKTAIFQTVALFGLGEDAVRRRMGEHEGAMTQPCAEGGEWTPGDGDGSLLEQFARLVNPPTPAASELAAEGGSAPSEAGLGECGYSGDAQPQAIGYFAPFRGLITEQVVRFKRGAQNMGADLGVRAAAHSLIGDRQQAAPGNSDDEASATVVSFEPSETHPPTRDTLDPGSECRL